MPTVTAYGLDYSARELTVQEILDYNRSNPPERISYLIRYIGYPGNKKCISHYPGALRAFEAAGIVVLLVHQIGYLDFHGGYEAGRQHAQTALADARREGYPDDRPIFFAFDRWLGGNQYAGPLPIAKVWEYLEGAKSVLGHDRVGLYGFFDVIHPAIRENRVRWTWLCGAESNVIDGVDFYQWNNGRRYPGRPPLETDLNKAYVALNTFGVDEMSAEAERKIGELYDWLLGTGTDSEHAARTGETPPGMGPGAGYKLILDTNMALRPVWELTGKNIGQALAELVGDPGSPVTGDDAQRIITRLESTLPAAVVDALRTALNATAAEGGVS